MSLRLALLATLLIAVSTAALADTVPPCALSGSNSVIINGRQALRLSDVRNCPPELYDISDSFFLDGEPTVFFKGGKSGKTSCGARGAMDVIIDGRQANRVGDVECKTAE